MKELRRSRRLADPHILLCAQLKVTLQPRRSMLGALALLSMRQEQSKAAALPPLRLAGRQELVDHDLRTVGEVTELRLPYHQRILVHERIAILERHHSGL